MKYVKVEVRVSEDGKHLTILTHQKCADEGLQKKLEEAVTKIAEEIGWEFCGFALGINKRRGFHNQRFREFATHFRRNGAG